MNTNRQEAAVQRPGKVVVYRSRLLPYSETFIKEQVRMLTRWQAILAGEIRAPDGLSLDGIDVRLLGYRSTPLRQLKKLICAFAALPSARVKALMDERPDLLHIHFAIEAFWIWPLAKKLDIPVLITLHGYDINIHRAWWETGGAGLIMKRYPSRLMEMAHDKRVHFVAVSQAIRQRAIEYGIPADKITVSYIGIDTRDFKPGGKPIAARRDILYVGRLVEKKGCEYLLQAFAGIQDRFPEYRLVMVGDGPLEAQLKAFARDRGIRAHFTGALSPAQVRERLNEARVFCLPSVTAENGDAEGLGLVILEAQASGVPVITSARGGAQEGIVHGKTGFAHAEKDVAAIQEGLIALLGNDALAERFGRSGRQHVVETMEIGSCILQLEDIYDRHAFGTSHAVQTPSPQAAPIRLDAVHTRNR